MNLHNVNYHINLINFLIQASPKITLPDPAPIIRAYPGYKLWCSATGTLPLHIVLTKNSTVLANSTNTATITLSEEGNYSCTASSHYGTDKKHFSVVFIGEIFFVKVETGRRWAIILNLIVRDNVQCLGSFQTVSTYSNWGNFNKIGFFDRMLICRFQINLSKGYVSFCFLFTSLRHARSCW